MLSLPYTDQKVHLIHGTKVKLRYVKNTYRQGSNMKCFATNEYQRLIEG